MDTSVFLALALFPDALPAEDLQYTAIDLGTLIADGHGRPYALQLHGEAVLPGIAAEDIGRCAYGIFRKGRAYIGKTVGIAGEHVTGDGMAAGLSKALGREVRYAAVTPDVYRGFGFPGADDLGNMFQFNRDFSDDFCAARSFEFSRSLHPGLQNFEQWLARNAKRIPLE